MAVCTEVFERKEIKYRLSKQQHQMILAALAGRMAPDAYGCTRVTSIYFDTADRQLIERSLDKPLYKEKLRMRWYGQLQMDGSAFIEIKKKFAGIVYKRRVGCSFAAARAYLKGLPYGQACRCYPLADELAATESLAPRSLQIAHEIDRFIMRYRPLQPSMLIACDRTAYAPSEDNCGTHQLDDVRITFDCDIAFGDLFEGASSLVKGGALPLVLAPGEAVMEIKVAGPFPLWLARALAACEAYPSSFSKYGEAYRMCMRSQDSGARVVPAIRVPATAAASRSESCGAHARRGPSCDRTPRAAHAAFAEAGERLASASPDALPRRFQAPQLKVKKGGRCV